MPPQYFRFKTYFCGINNALLGTLDTPVFRASLERRAGIFFGAGVFLSKEIFDFFTQKYAHPNRFF
jgi:hypothetical protein